MVAGGGGSPAQPSPGLRDSRKRSAGLQVAAPPCCERLKCWLKCARKWLKCARKASKDGGGSELCAQLWVRPRLSLAKTGGTRWGTWRRLACQR